MTISLGPLPGELAAVVHLTELVAHGADIAVAVGRQDLIDDAGCARLLARMAAMDGVDAYLGRKV